jgi:hypothetical protein
MTNGTEIPNGGDRLLDALDGRTGPALGLSPERQRAMTQAIVHQVLVARDAAQAAQAAQAAPTSPRGGAAIAWLKLPNWRSGSK